MNITVIVPTYNNPAALRHCLLGFASQTFDDFDLLIIDDGSRPETRAVLDEPVFSALSMRYLWQRDDGFRKNLLLNRAIAVAEGDYLIFCDGDCIPRNDFVASHVRFARPNRYVSGARIEVPAAVHKQFTDEVICSGEVFDPGYLANQDASLAKYQGRLTTNRWLAGAGDLLTTRLYVFHGSNAGAWRSDLLRINGFDENFEWGSDDRDVGARLKNVGVWSAYKKYSLVQMHLEHPRGWADPVASQRNRARFKSRLWMLDRTVKADPGVATALDRSDEYRLERVGDRECELVA